MMAAITVAVLAAGAIGGMIGHFAFDDDEERAPAARPAQARGATAAAAPATSKDDLVLASRADGVSGAAANGDSFSPDLSEDGRYVAFASEADNLSSADDDSVPNVFRRDLQTGTTVLVSRASGATGAAANAKSFLPQISGDGRYVFFVSYADNLSTQDQDGVPSIFRRDLVTNTTTYVARNDITVLYVTGVGEGENRVIHGSYRASPSGRYVAFDSEGESLTPDDGNQTDVFLRDIDTGTTTFASRVDGASGGSPAGAGGKAVDSEVRGVSDDGRYVAFSTLASGVAPGANASARAVYRRDLVAGNTILVSRASGASGAQANGTSGGTDGELSSDGNCVFFSSTATNLSSADTAPDNDMYARDVVSNLTVLVSRADGAEGASANDSAFFGDVTPHGASAVFLSRATNLSSEDGEGFPGGTGNVYVRRLLGGTTTYVSRAAGAAGAAANDWSESAAVSANGRFVAFTSAATNLSTVDVDPVEDVFVRDVSGPPRFTPRGGFTSPRLSQCRLTPRPTLPGG